MQQSQVTTDNIHGVKVASIEDGVIMLQIFNNTAVNLYITTDDGLNNTNFKNQGITISPGTLWPTNGPTMWYGRLHVWGDAKATFSIIKSLTISKKGIFS